MFWVVGIGDLVLFFLNHNGLVFDLYMTQLTIDLEKKRNHTVIIGLSDKLELNQNIFSLLDSHHDLLANFHPKEEPNQHLHK